MSSAQAGLMTALAALREVGAPESAVRDVEQHAKEVMRECDDARRKANEWHRRAQKAEAVVAKGVEKQVGLEHRGSVGRALANVAAAYYKDQADRLREHLDVLRDMTRHIPDEHAASSVRGEIDQALKEAS